MAKKKRKSHTRRAARIRSHYLHGISEIAGFKMRTNLIIGAAIGGFGSAVIDKYLPLQGNIKPLAQIGIGAILTGQDGDMMAGIGAGMIGGGTKTFAASLPFLQGLGEGVGAKKLDKSKAEVKKNEEIIFKLDGDEEEPPAEIQGGEDEEERTQAETMAGILGEGVVITGEDDEEAINGPPAILGII